MQVIIIIFVRKISPLGWGKKKKKKKEKQKRAKCNFSKGIFWKKMAHKVVNFTERILIFLILIFMKFLPKYRLICSSLLPENYSILFLKNFSTFLSLLHVAKFG